MSRTLVSFALAFLTLTIGAACATDGDESDKPKSGKHKFKPDDYEMGYLEKGQTEAKLKPAVTDKIVKVVDLAERRLPTALAPVPPPLPAAIIFAVGKCKPLIVSALKEPLFKMIDDHPKEVSDVIERYNVFGPEMTYDLLDPSGDAASMVGRVNDTLKRAYRTARSLRLARNFLVVAKKDAVALKTAPDIPRAAGIGVAGLAITELSLEALDHAQTLLPELKQLEQDLANQMGANPMQTVSLAPAVASVSGAIADLGTVPKDAADLLSEAADLLETFKTISTSPAATSAPPPPAG